MNILKLWENWVFIISGNLAGVWRGFIGKGRELNLDLLFLYYTNRLNGLRGGTLLAEANLWIGKRARFGKKKTHEKKKNCILTCTLFSALFEWKKC